MTVVQASFQLPVCMPFLPYPYKRPVRLDEHAGKTRQMLGCLFEAGDHGEGDLVGIRLQHGKLASAERPAIRGDVAGGPSVNGDLQEVHVSGLSRGRTAE